MGNDGIEAIYEAIATKIDEVGKEQVELYLAKLALLLAKAVGNPQTAIRCVSDAAASLIPAAESW